MGNNNTPVRGKKYRKKVDGTYVVPWYDKVKCPFGGFEYCKGPKCMMFSVEDDTCEMLLMAKATRFIARKVNGMADGGAPADLVKLLAGRMDAGV